MVLSVSNVSCGYKNNILLKSVNFTVKKTECICLLGPNGIGKTTLFKTLLGLLDPVEGTISVGDRSIRDLSERERAGIFAYIPQQSQIFFPYTVLDIIVMGSAARIGLGSVPGKEVYDEARWYLETLSIAHLECQTFSNLSGGEKQLVLIARALFQQAEFLMMDEPSSALDFGNESLFLSRVLSLKDEGKGFIMITHNPNHAFILADTVILITSQGELVTGPPDDVITPENIKSAYGVEGIIHSHSYSSGKRIFFCLPAIAGGLF